MKRPKITLKQKQKRIRIARLDGWTNIHYDEFGQPRGYYDNGRGLAYLPDYLTSRDSIVEAMKRKFITTEDHCRFIHFWIEAHGDTFLMITADAEKLADIYLKAAQK